MAKVTNNAVQSYLIGTAYVGTASTNLGTNLNRWLKDGAQATSGNANRRWIALLKLAPR